MFDLLLYDAKGRGVTSEGKAFLEHLRLLKLTGASRIVTNREYFIWWAGRCFEDIQNLGREWFAKTVAERGTSIIYPEVRDLIQEHKEHGTRIVFVSGSFYPALAPLADLLKVDDVLASEPVITRGVLTGEINRPMIAEAKADAVRAHSLRHGLDLGSCFGYGDDTSDVPFMQITGNPVAVGHEQSSFGSEASQYGWPLIHIKQQL